MDIVDLLIGLQWVLDNIHLYKPAVVLLSLHVRGNDPGVEDLIMKIVEAGVLIVTSAGNSGTGTFSVNAGKILPSSQAHS